MSWAAERRTIVLLIMGGIIAAIVAVVLIATLYKAPSCGDGVQNQDESGIDCGGACAYLCRAELIPPTVLYTKPLVGISDRTSIIASVENKNPAAGAKNIPYTVSLFDARQTLIQESSGFFDLPPGASVPLYISGVTSGKQTVTAAFVTIDPSVIGWYSLPKDPRLMPIVSNITLGGTEAMPQVTATLSNASVIPLRNVKVVAVVHEANGNVVAASQTITQQIPGQGSAQAIFTWNTAFSAPAVTIEVVPIIPLP